ncbi:MAG TPA: SMP-30/gluconolactonase/LRE family protein [Candidatus Elarobacter sp.]|nr:SMP-30/gluconolactonase/LRE family protein [Candidatus Elarobacter sp.]
MNELKVREIASGVGATEGPVIRADGEIVFVSLDQQRLCRINDGVTSVLAELPGAPNGATEARDGTIYVAQCGGRWGRNKHPDWSLVAGVQAVTRDGAVRWVSTDPIAPNDLCFGPDGLLYVTDPTRYREPRDDGRIFRIDVATGEAELLTVPWYPNGIGFGIEDDAVYVAKSGPEFDIMRLPLDHGRWGKPEIFARMGTYKPDGFLFDAEGNLTTAAIATADGPGRIETYDRDARLIDVFVPGPAKEFTNVALSEDRTLIITAPNDGAVLAVYGWPRGPLPLHPFREHAARV